MDPCILNIVTRWRSVRDRIHEPAVYWIGACVDPGAGLRIVVAKTSVVFL
jgi:hypothetical protein